MTKYYKRGLREYFQVTPTRVIKITNKLAVSYITIAYEDTEYEWHLAKVTKTFLNEEALEGQEITKEEFAEQFKIASRLIVLEP